MKTYRTLAEAKRRKAEIEYKEKVGTFVVPQCKYLKELLDEYINLYGKENWALSTYDGNVGIINNYIRPIIGDTKLVDINTRFIEKYYQELLQTPPVYNSAINGRKSEFVTTGTIREVHKILKSCFKQAIKWDIMQTNPAELATVPKHKAEKREIWTAEDLIQALDACDDEGLSLALNLTFTASLRMGELLGLTWDCVDISDEAINNHRSYVFINKEVQRISKDAAAELSDKDIMFKFPEQSKKNNTVRVLKTLKAESSMRKVFIPDSVAKMLQAWKEKQDTDKEFLGNEYQDFNLIMATSYGLPMGDAHIRTKMNKLIRENDLPKVVFHSLRHTSVTYKLKLNGGDIKAVQGDSGHAQANMVTDVYSHIIDDDRRKNAELIEEAFYQRKNLDPNMAGSEETVVKIPAGVDAELLSKVISNPEMMALLQSMAAALKK